MTESALAGFAFPDQCRGNVQQTAVLSGDYEGKLGFNLVVFANAEGDTLILQLLRNNGAIITLDQTFTFVSGGSQGTLAVPVELTGVFSHALVVLLQTITALTSLLHCMLPDRWPTSSITAAPLLAIAITVCASSSAALESIVPWTIHAAITSSTATAIFTWPTAPSNSPTYAPTNIASSASMPSAHPSIAATSTVWRLV